MKTISQILEVARSIKDSTAWKSITATKLGQLLVDITDYLSGVDKNANAMSVRKTYGTYEDMVADTYPVYEVDGVEFKLKFGQHVSVTNDGNDNGLYRFLNPGWDKISGLGDLVGVSQVLGDSTTAVVSQKTLTESLQKAVEMIAHNATAPSPVIPTGTTKTYEFSTDGVCAWLSNASVLKLDKVTVQRTGESTWRRTHIPNVLLKNLSNVFSKQLVKTIVTETLYNQHGGDVRSLMPLTGYKTIAFKTADDETIIYYNEIPANVYYAITYSYNNNGSDIILNSMTVGGYNFTADVSVRKRKSEGNLPTINNPVIVPKNTLIFITVKDNEEAFYYSEQYSNIFNPEIRLNDSQITQVINSLPNEIPKCVVKKEDDTRIGVYTHVRANVYIYFPIKHVVNVSTNTDYWKIFNSYKCTYSNGEFVKEELVLWGDQGENESVILITGGSDHTGGYHGDEIYTTISFYIDGLEYSLEEITDSINCNSFKYMVKSNMYGNAIGDTDAIIEHYKTTMIQNGGYTTENRLKFLKQSSVDRFYAGLFCVSNNVASYWTSGDFIIRQKKNDGSQEQPAVNYTDLRIDYWNQTTGLSATVDGKVIYGLDASKFWVNMWDRGGVEPDVKYYNCTHATYQVELGLDCKFKSSIYFYIE